jgi:hypothetical protein
MVRQTFVHGLLIVRHSLNGLPTMGVPTSHTVTYPPLSCFATIVGACRVTDEPG